MLNKFEEFVIGMTRNGYESEGIWHAQANFLKGREFHMLILETLPDGEHVARMRREIRDHEIDAYVVCNLAGRHDSASKSVRIFENVIPLIPTAGAPTGEHRDLSTVDEVMFFFCASRNGRAKTFAMDVIGPKKLGAVRDVTDVFEGPFADLFPRKPRREDPTR